MHCVEAKEALPHHHAFSTQVSPTKPCREMLKLQSGKHSRSHRTIRTETLTLWFSGSWKQRSRKFGKRYKPTQTHMSWTNWKWLFSIVIAAGRNSKTRRRGMPFSVTGTVAETWMEGDPGSQSSQTLRPDATGILSPPVLKWLLEFFGLVRPRPELLPGESCVSQLV